MLCQSEVNDVSHTEYLSLPLECEILQEFSRDGVSSFEQHDHRLLLASIFNDHDLFHRNWIYEQFLTAADFEVTWMRDREGKSMPLVKCKFVERSMSVFVMVFLS